LSIWLIYALGFFAQSLFGARTVVQWIRSEREGRVTSPTLFWVLSLAGSFLFLIYGWLRHDAVILFGQTLSYYIYIRNLQLKKFWKRIPLFIRIVLLPLPGLLYVMSAVYNPKLLTGILDQTDFTDTLILIGSAGQLLLNFRYLYQWYYSERANQSLLPMGFWVISAVASVMVVVYGVYRHDPVLLTAQGLGLFAYLRNIFWSVKHRHPYNEI
jgi:lipid-A-disaccharide synthase-like uncharacterized protein